MRKRKEIRSHARFIDPEECGSMVGYRLTLPYATLRKDGTECVHYKYQGAITLTDCSRSINWEVHFTPEGLAKLEKAISVLERARDIVKREMVIPEDLEDDE